jgi:hypothetical protein
VAALSHWRGLFANVRPEHFVFPHEKYGLAGNDRQLCAYEIIPTEPMHRWKVAWEGARKVANVSCRFHDLRHTFISRLAESQASDSTVMALAGHVSRAMMERYSHIRMEAKRRAVDDLSGTDFEPGVAQNWAQFVVSNKSGGANLLKNNGDPGRTRTCNPLLNPEMLCSWFFKHFLASYITILHGVRHGSVPKLVPRLSNATSLSFRLRRWGGIDRKQC